MKNGKIIFSKNKENLPFKLILCYNWILIKHDIITNDPIFYLLSNFEEITSLKGKKEYIKFLYCNRNNIESILYNEEKIIEIESVNTIKTISDYFYLSLIIKNKNNLVHYSYSINFIKEINEQRKIVKEVFQKVIISKIILELIENYKQTDNYKEKEEEEELTNIFQENIGIIESNLNVFKELNENWNLEKIQKKKIDEIYIQLILDLIKTRKYGDTNILNQLDLENIYITETVMNHLFDYLENKNNINISQIEQIFNNEALSLFYFIFKYLLKEQVFIFKSIFLSQIKRFILKIIKEEKDKFLKYYESNNIENKNKIKFILELFLESNYYLNILNLNNAQNYQNIPENSQIMNLNNHQQENTHNNNQNNNLMNIPIIINENNFSNNNSKNNSIYENDPSFFKNNSNIATDRKNFSSSNFSNPLTRDSVDQAHKSPQKEIDTFEVNNLNNEELLIDILTKSIFQFHINENDEKHNIIYGLIKAGQKTYKKIEEIKEMILEFGKNDKLYRSFNQFTSFLNKIETEIQKNYKKKHKLEITIKFNQPENPETNSSYYEIDCLYYYKLNNNNNNEEFSDKNCLNDKELEGLYYLLNEINNED